MIREKGQEEWRAYQERGPLGYFKSLALAARAADDDKPIGSKTLEWAEDGTTGRWYSECLSNLEIHLGPAEGYRYEIAPINIIEKYDAS